MTDFFLRKMEQRDPTFDATPESTAPTILPPLPPTGPRPAPAAETRVMENAKPEPAAAPVETLRDGVAPPKAPAPPARAAGASPQVFTADTSASIDPLRPEEPLSAIAELLAHAATPGPLTVGLFGRAGSGKSTALDRLDATVRAIADAARPQKTGTPYLGELVTVRIDAARLDGEPANGIADAIHQSLSAGPYADLAAEAAHAVRDPALVARELGEKLADSRLRLDNERRALQELDGRRAKLPETILYETPGSRVDAHARANRGRIENRMRGFGFSGDPVTNYKDLVRDLAERPTAGGRAGAFLHAMWGFKGQTRLLVFAGLFFVLAWLLGLTQTHGPSWIAWLGANGGENIGPVTTWLGAHLDWLGVIRLLAILAALACIALNVWRAVRFTLPILRGVTLLRADEDARSRDLSGLLALQTRRVETLSAEAEALARQTEAAERRVTASAGASPQRTETPFSDVPAEARTRPARDFIRALDRAMAGRSDAGMAAPQRIVVSVDSLDDLPPPRRLAVAQAVHNLLDGRHFATVLAADPMSLESAGARLDKLVQLPIRVDVQESDPSGWARSFIEGARAGATTKIEAKSSRLDDAMSAAESDLLTELAPIAGNSPRAVKHFVNVYRIARVTSNDRPALALMLALLMGGGADDRARLSTKIAALDAQLSAGGSDARMGFALAAVERVRGRPLDMDTARRAYRLAQSFSLAA